MAELVTQWLTLFVVEPTKESSDDDRIQSTEATIKKVERVVDEKNLRHKSQIA